MDEQSQEIYEIKLRPPKETMNLTIPVDMHIDDLLGALGTMFQILLCLKDNKPDVISHEYRCNDFINALIRECELNTTQKTIVDYLFSIGFDYKYKDGKNKRTVHTGKAFVTGYSWNDEEGITISTRFGEDIDRFLSGELSIGEALRLDWVPLFQAQKILNQEEKHENQTGTQQTVSAD